MAFVDDPGGIPVCSDTRIISLRPQVGLLRQETLEAGVTGLDAGDEYLMGRTVRPVIGNMVAADYRRCSCSVTL